MSPKKEDFRHHSRIGLSKLQCLRCAFDCERVLAQEVADRVSLVAPYAADPASWTEVAQALAEPR